MHPSRRGRRRRALGHVCPRCRRAWALRAQVDERAHPGGVVIRTWVIRCRHCGHRDDALEVRDDDERLLLVRDDGPGAAAR